MYKVSITNENVVISLYGNEPYETDEVLHEISEADFKAISAYPAFNCWKLIDGKLFKFKEVDSITPSTLPSGSIPVEVL